MTIDLWIMVLYFSAVLLLGLLLSKKIKTAVDSSIENLSYSASIIFATLSSAFIGGGFTNGLAWNLVQKGEREEVKKG